MNNPEKERLQNPEWQKWGPYLSDRQWGIVREDYSRDGQAWLYTTHDMARSKAYRWGEEGIAGISDDKQLLCFALAFWNGKDPILKERYFGLTPMEGNHGEDVKEYYYYLDNTPTHSYMKMVYKYPQQAFPYNQLLEENKKRGLHDKEFELIDTRIFEQNEYFDIEIEYAKKSQYSNVIKITVHNRSPQPATLELLPTLWFRNTWSWNLQAKKPALYTIAVDAIKAEHPLLDAYTLYCKGCNNIYCCENETNDKKLYNYNNNNLYPKDAINDFIIHNLPTINPDKGGTKAAAHYSLHLNGLSSTSIYLQLTNEQVQLSEDEIETVFKTRITEANLFYAELQKEIKEEELKNIQRQALAGLLWSKQFYYYHIEEWLKGDKNMPPPPQERLDGRNSDWKHLYANDIIVMPDKWEYPWFAAWDTAFQAVPLYLVDPVLAKQQIILLTHEWYMHPTGQLPAYEWEFNNINPPVHAWATWYIYEADKKANEGKGDFIFLKSVFNRLIINFTWWVNREDAEGNNIFEGGFLGLDNIEIFDRSKPLPTGGIMEQADGTSWMALYCLKMMRMALELATNDPVYEDMATKFFEHFMYIANAMNSMGNQATGMWDDEDSFFYDQIKFPDKSAMKLKVRSLVGLLPILCVEVIDHAILKQLPNFNARLNWFLKNKPDFASLVSRWDEQGQNDKHIFSLLRGHRLKGILRKMLDPAEFLSDYGIRSLSKFHEKNPYELYINEQRFEVKYTPAESDSTMFGGNSNWRGPIWMPVNFLLTDSLEIFYEYYGQDFLVEYPTGANEYHTLQFIAAAISLRVIKIYRPDEGGARAVFSLYPKMQLDENFKNKLLFFEYFDGDTGRGVGASHQTGWTSLIATFIKLNVSS